MRYKEKFATLCSENTVIDGCRVIYIGYVYHDVGASQLNFFALDKKISKSVGLAEMVGRYLRVFYFKFTSIRSENNDEFQCINKWMLTFSVLGNFIISGEGHDAVAGAYCQGFSS